MKILVVDHKDHTKKVFDFDSEVIPNVGDYVYTIGKNYYEVIQRIFGHNASYDADVVLVAKEVRD